MLSNQETRLMEFDTSGANKWIRTSLAQDPTWLRLATPKLTFSLYHPLFGIDMG